MQMMESKVQVRVLMSEIKNGITRANNNTEISQWLSLIGLVVSPAGIAEESIEHNERFLETLGYDKETLLTIAAKLQSAPGLVQQLCECVISKFSIDWMTELTPEMFDQVGKPIFLNSVPDEAFVALYFTVVERKTKDFCFHKCISLLEELLTRENLYALLKKQSLCGNNALRPNTSSSTLNVTAEVLVNSLASLPVKMANKLQLENSDKFLPQKFVTLLALSVLDVLHWAHDIVTTGQSVSLQVVSSLVGKLAITGHADDFLDTLVPRLCAHVRTDFVWNRICERVFVQVPALSLEPVLVPLLRRIPWYGLVYKFLGDSILHNNGLKVMMCTKLLLHRHYTHPKNLLQNIIGYLMSCTTRRHLYLEVFMTLLSVWGNKTSMQHISVEQHLYIAKTLMICIGCLTKTDKEEYKGEMLRLLMPGVQAHLESSDHQVRMQGMVVAKTLVNVVDPTGPQVDFQLDTKHVMTRVLLAYLILPSDPGPTAEEEAALKQDKECKTEERTKKKPKQSSKQTTKNPDPDLDSDDDLVPYDMSNDKKVSEAKPPKYIRECMEGLICSTENPDRTEVCLQHAEGLISRHIDGLEEIAAEFAKILLHLSDSHSFDNFFLHRFRALVALTVACPAQVAEYLTAQFYERNYSLRHRMEILEVLAAAAQELSQPEQSKSATADKPANLITEMNPASSEPETWRDVVQRRIDSNTRRFAYGRTRPEPTARLNRFAAVAGQFLYPLMARVDQREPFLDLMGQDSALLFRLLYTLAMVVNAATNTPAVSKMGRTLLEFTWPVRMHTDQLVRQAVITATSTVFVSVPTHYLLSEINSEITETRGWLEDVVVHDADTECQQLAAQALLILQEQVKKELADAQS